ncbi:uncharacterized protein (UPF0332 family) [Rhizobium aquaticum]|uniref:Uncharacterized protein (UPF0332 family) n=1 Tax=Rhizobium aquaticum TaxID=1549636 RepID=A0ABV2J186_9HYPH
MTKAARALASARLLLDAGDTDGVCNRIYYTMFDAAKAALMATDAPPEAIDAKTHSGLIAAFSFHVVKRGFVVADHGRSFNRLHELRMIADYRGDAIEEPLVRQAITDATAFVSAVEALLKER